MNTNSSLNEVVVNLVDGPSRDRLIDAFKYAEDDSTLVPVDFYTKSKEKIPIVPTMLEHEDGSGHSFNGHGYVTVDTIAGIVLGIVATIGGDDALKTEIAVGSIGSEDRYARVNLASVVTGNGDIHQIATLVVDDLWGPKP